MPAEDLAPASPPRPRRPLAAARNAAVFLAALVAASSLLTALSPFPDLGNLARKYHHITRKDSGYSVIYVGSSRVFHEFIPEKFDAELAARGHAVRSFNFGQDGMWPPESLYMLRRILDARPPGLRWVFIDLMDIRPQAEANEDSLRMIHWHDFEHTLLACRGVIASQRTGLKTFSEKAAACANHARLFLRRGTSLGTGHKMLAIELRLSPLKKPPEVAHGGYEPGDPGPLTGAQRAQFLAEVEALKRGAAPRPIPPVLRSALDKVTAEIRAAGAEPLYVVASNLYGAERFSDWPPAGVKLLAFDDPLKFPQLYDPDRRFDPHHLDPAGAEIFTRLLAEHFAAMLEAAR